MPSGRVLRLFWEVNKVKAVLLDICLLPEAKILLIVAEAPTYARGFIGLTFRIDESDQFERIYLRQTNNQAYDQLI